MSTPPNPELVDSQSLTKVMWVVLLLLPVGGAFVTGLFTDFGSTAEPLFFEVMAAGVLPILLVAVIVQYSLVLSQVIPREISETDREVMRYEHAQTTRLYGALFATGEGAALFAVAADKQSTFLLLVTLLYAALLLVSLLFEVEYLFEPEVLLPSTQRREEQARLMGRAERHEELAAKLRGAARDREGDP